jgi:hypothetical protein
MIQLHATFLGDNKVGFSDFCANSSLPNDSNGLNPRSLPAKATQQYDWKSTSSKQGFLILCLGLK